MQNDELVNLLLQDLKARTRAVMDTVLERLRDLPTPTGNGPSCFCSTLNIEPDCVRCNIPYWEDPDYKETVAKNRGRYGEFVKVNF